MLYTYKFIIYYRETEVGKALQGVITSALDMSTDKAAPNMKELLNDTTIRHAARTVSAHTPVLAMRRLCTMLQEDGIEYVLRISVSEAVAKKRAHSKAVKAANKRRKAGFFKRLREEQGNME